jgi:hypothetical protein
MERFFILDNQNTWYDFTFFLTNKVITPPELKTNYVEIDGMSGSLDLSESLTGEITYKDRTISASFCTDYGKRADRLKITNDFVKAVHGRKIKIIEPDDPKHYFYGRVSVKNIENILPYSTVDIEAVCEPWRYALHESIRTVDVNGSVDVVINNHGIKTLCPDLVIDGKIIITQNNLSVSLSNGSYKISDLKLTRGSNVLTVSGKGSISFVYREADL